MTRKWFPWLIGAGLVALALAATLYVSPQLPDQIPTHWNLKGEVDGYGSKRTLFLMPAAMLGLLGLFALIPKISPKPFAVDEFQGTYLTVMYLSVGLMGYIHAVILYATFHPELSMLRALVLGAMLGLAGLGNLFGKIRRNLYMGIRTPWTLANDRVWNDTHRLGAWMTVAGGLLGALFCLAGLPVWSALIPIAPAIIVPIVYSYTHYEALEAQGEH